MNSRRSWLIWAIAIFAYIVGVLQRSSLGVSGIEAAHRFEVSASVLSSLAVVQIIVYAALQIPVGVVLDRVGPKALVAAGALLMLAGQVVLALAPSIGVAIVGRVLVGAGDAMTFISVIRLLASWFNGRLLPQVSQWTGNLGQLGQVLSAIPLSFLLHTYGWTPAFLSAASMSAIALVLVLVLLSNGAADVARADRVTTWPHAMRQLREALARPGTRLGFWSHFTTQSSGTVFSLLWGFPMLTAGLGYSPATASGLLTLIVGAGVVSGPILGLLTARFPLRRSNLVLAIVTMIGIAWTVVLLWPGHPPFVVVVILIIVLGIGGPGSLIGFDFARTFNPMRSLGSANGVVNVGGFLASFVMMYLIGLVLDVLNRLRIDSGAASDVFAWESFRVAFTVQYAVVGAGVVFLLLARRSTRRRLHEDEGIRVAPLWVALSRALRRHKI
ncbi:nitrate/nitrite transporter [Lacisediminihabitans sp.]|uniref:MFS transporter n=1 Tax=Lacisediminihabitans sp. TaxID=2787631 RepID=UPI00374D312D